ncbi:4Fe-4S dicluster domain-containing protein [Chloroflexota bacterium]
MKVIIFDAAKCNGCHSCQVACKDEHCGNDWMPFAKPQPETGQFWFKMNEFVRGSVPKVKSAYVPTMCMHCDEAPCIPACPNTAVYKREDGFVILDPAKCTGTQNCIDACPYGGVISFNQDLKISQKCTGCAHLLDNPNSPIDTPRCVDACVTGALTYGEEADLQDLIAGAEVLLPKSGDDVQPRVYYINLPKRFIAGTVYDPVAEEVVIGATCSLSGDASVTATTDEFGDFWFEGLEVGTYDLKIEAAGFAAKEIAAISTADDVNLGDLALA